MTKLLSCRYNMDTNRVEARFEDETVLSIDCAAVEDEYGSTPAQRAELDWLLSNKPLEYAQLVLGGGMEHYLSLGCDHGRLEDCCINHHNSKHKTKPPQISSAKNSLIRGSFIFWNPYSRLRASSSATRMQSGCIWRMEPGHSGVTGPDITALTALAFARPLATTSTLRACMMVLMPMV